MSSEYTDGFLFNNFFFCVFFTLFFHGCPRFCGWFVLFYHNPYKMAIAILGLSYRRFQNSTILRYTYYVFSNASYIAPCRIYFFINQQPPVQLVVCYKPSKGLCYCSPQRAVPQAFLLVRYKAVLLESSFLDSSACSFIYFCTASSVILPIVST